MRSAPGCRRPGLPEEWDEPVPYAVPLGGWANGALAFGLPIGPTNTAWWWASLTMLAVWTGTSAVILLLLLPFRRRPPRRTPPPRAAPAGDSGHSAGPGEARV